MINIHSDFNPLVTIVTVSYNAETIIEQTINSVLNQNYSNLEYIIIDGNSSDNTVQIIRKYKDHLAIWISEPDIGIYDAMNKGINLAHGQWINFLNAGDTFHSRDVISDIINEIDNNTQLICGNINLVTDNGEIVALQQALPLSHFWEKMLCCHQAMFVKTELLKKHPFNIHYQYSSDVDFFSSLALNENNYKKIDKTIVNFLQDGCSQRNLTKAHLEVLYIISQKIPDINQIYQHSSFEALFMGNSESTFNHNLYFSKMYNRLTKELKNIKEQQEPVFLYGYGHIGQFIETQLTEQITLIVDKNYYNINCEKVKSPEILINLSNKIIISVLGREKEIRQELIEKYQYIPKNIITLNLSF